VYVTTPCTNPVVAMICCPAGGRYCAAAAIWLPHVGHALLYASVM
jgi:hypothetical protein